MPLAYPLAVYRGDTFAQGFRLWDDVGRSQPVDLAGATVTAQIRTAPDAAVVADFDVAITLPNTVTVSLAATVTAAAASGFWDLQVLEADGTVTTYVNGRVTVTPDITQP